MRLRAAAALILALAFASACTGSSTPQVLPTLTATPTPSSTAVSVPASATAPTSQALDAFVRFYFAQLNAAFSTANPALIRQLSSSDCSTCENYAKSLGTDGNHVLGDTFVGIDVAAPPIGKTGTIVEVTGTVGPRDLADESGRVIKHLPAGGRFHFQVNVIRAASGWIVRGIRTAS